MLCKENRHVRRHRLQSQQGGQQSSPGAAGNWAGWDRCEGSSATIWGKDIPGRGNSRTESPRWESPSHNGGGVRAEEGEGLRQEVKSDGQRP